MAGTLTSPTRKCAAVTASDTVAITGGPTRGLLVKTAGDYTLLLADNAAAVAINLAAGVIHPLCVTRVNATSAASADGIVGFW